MNLNLPQEGELVTIDFLGTPMRGTVKQLYAAIDAYNQFAIKMQQREEIIISKRLAMGFKLGRII